MTSNHRAGLFLGVWGVWAAVAASGCQSEPCLSALGPVVCTVAGTGRMGFNKDGLQPEDSDLYLPSTLRRGPDGLVYLMDFNNHRLRRIDAAGRLQTIAGDGFHSGAAVGQPAVDSPLENPIDFDFSPEGRVIFISYHDPRVLQISAAGVLEVVAGTGGLALSGNEGDGGPALLASFIQLSGLAIGPDGAIYVSDDEAHRVRVIHSGGRIETLAGTGVQDYSGDGGPAAAAALNRPAGLAIDRTGNLFIADGLNHAVRKVAPDGTIETVAGTGQAGFGGDGGPATAARLSFPEGVALDAVGTLYITDRNNYRIRRVTPDGIIDTVAGTGERGSSGDRGPPLSARFGVLGRLSVDGDKTLLVADQSNSRVRAVVLSR